MMLTWRSKYKAGSALYVESCHYPPTPADKKTPPRTGQGGGTDVVSRSAFVVAASASSEGLDGVAGIFRGGLVRRIGVGEVDLDGLAFGDLLVDSLHRHDEHVERLRQKVAEESAQCARRPEQDPQRDAFLVPCERHLRTFCRGAA